MNSTPTQIQVQQTKLNKVPTLEESSQMPDVILNNTNEFQHRLD